MAKYLDKIGLSYFWSLIKSKLIPAGGQQGQVLAKASSADDDVTWVSTGVNNLIGDNLVAASNRQIVIGQYNEADSDEHAIIVGNGTDDTDRQNVFMVDRDGNLEMIGTLVINNSEDSGYNSNVVVYAPNEVEIGTSANNGVTYLRQSSVKCLDKNNTELGALVVAASTDGSVRTYIRSANMSTNGTRVENNLVLCVNKDGSRTVGFSAPNPWLNALGLNVSTAGTGTSTGITKGSACSSCNAFLRKTGRVVQLAVHTLKLTSNLASNATSGTVLTLPVGYRPAIEIIAPWAGSGAAYGYLSLKTNGVLTLHNSSTTAQSTGGSAFINITYIV